MRWPDQTPTSAMVMGKIAFLALSWQDVSQSPPIARSNWDMNETDHF
jgi:hypothetical protein